MYSDIKISQLFTRLGLDTEQTIEAATSEGFEVLFFPLTRTDLGWIVDGFVKPSHEDIYFPGHTVGHKDIYFALCYIECQTQLNMSVSGSIEKYNLYLL